MAVKTYGHVKIAKTQFGIRFSLTEVAPHVCIRLKTLFRNLPRAQPEPFTLPMNAETCEDLRWFFNRYPFRGTDAAFEAIEKGSANYVRSIEEAESIFQPGYQPPLAVFKDGLEFRLYQAQFVELHKRVKRLLNADVVGLGKTPQGIGTLLNSGTLPALIVVQTHLTYQWKQEIEKFTDLRVHTIEGRTPYELPMVDVYIMKYSCIAYWLEYFASEQSPIKSLIFDEIQELRREDSDKYRAAKLISQRVDYCTGLSATPIYNMGDEIYNVIDLIKPGVLDLKHNFLREWCGSGGQVKDPQALGAYLRANHLMIRRTREEVKMELPVVNKIVHTVDFDHKEIERMENLAKTLAIKVTQGTFVERGQAARELDMLVRQATGISKAKYVAEYVRILLEGGEPVLLAGWHRAVYEIWNKELAAYNPVMYTGSESPKQKEEARQKFMSGESNLMMISLRSGIGLNGLQNRSSFVVFGELDWSPGVHEQVIGRLNRDGQQNQVTSVYLVSDSGSDPLVVNLLGLKGSQAAGIIDPFVTRTQTYSDESRIKLLAESFLNKTEEFALL
jgi:SNF2 family DNA or RNA helicase